MLLKMPSGVKLKKGYHLKVCIGTDSQVKGSETEFATVIVFLREGHGGFMFIHNEKTSAAIYYQRAYAGGSGQEHRDCV